MTSDPDDLRHLLERSVAGEVCFDAGTRAVYATDSSNYRHVPLGVVFPRDADDVSAALEACRAAGAPVVGRGAGTSLAGQACNEAVVIDTSRHLTRILALDPEARVARVEPGVVLDDLRRAAEAHGLTFGPDPATHAWCTLGGMIGNNSCGAHGLVAGKTVDNVEALTVLTFAGARLECGAGESALGDGAEARRIGEALRALVDDAGDLVRAHFPVLARRVSGYNLDALLPENGFHVARALVGTESTCALTLAATLRLVESPPERRLVVLGYADVFAAADAVPGLLAPGVVALEGFDETLVRQMRAGRLHLDKLGLLPEGRGWLLVEIGAGDALEADALAAGLAAGARDTTGAAVFSDPGAQRALWAIRESGLGATARPTTGAPNFEGWEDAAVPPERLGAYLRGIEELWHHYGYSGAWYGHFGQGCVHTRNNFDFSHPGGVARFRAYVEEAAALCVGLGGSLSGEHGDGQARAELLEKMFGRELVAAFERFKDVFDPDNKMNPGRVVRPRPLDADLHFGPGYRRVSLGPTRFALAADGGSLQQAAERCVGVGRCRSVGVGTMCPSFRATGDERHSTRGRAKLLVEMLQGETTPASWRNEDVRQALELCLSCKACAHECPTRVDMATYKAEFLSHYYAGRLRPASSYVLGLLPVLLRVASGAPRLANVLAGEHRLGRALRRRVGLSSARRVPPLAPRPFRRTRTPPTGASAPSVVVFCDTFSDNYLPERAAAAVSLLERLGERVVVPRRFACCGRPLFDQGMLATARRALRRTLSVLEPYLEAELPVVVLEPTCLATMRDELVELLPDDPRATRLARRARTLAEHLSTLPAPTLENAGPVAALHVHCHQRATAGDDAERELLRRWGLAADVLDTGCCGLAGGFGFTAGHEEVSRRVAEQDFLPALADVPDATLVTDGFSCALQAAELAGRPARHLAQWLLAALGDEPAR